MEEIPLPPEVDEEFEEFWQKNGYDLVMKVWKERYGNQMLDNNEITDSSIPASNSSKATQSANLSDKVSFESAVQSWEKSPEQEAKSWDVQSNEGSNANSSRDRMVKEIEQMMEESLNFKTSPKAGNVEGDATPAGPQVAWGQSDLQIGEWKDMLDEHSVKDSRSPLSSTNMTNNSLDNKDDLNLSTDKVEDMSDPLEPPSCSSSWKDPGPLASGSDALKWQGESDSSASVWHNLTKPSEDNPSWQDASDTKDYQREWDQLWQDTCLEIRARERMRVWLEMSEKSMKQMEPITSVSDIGKAKGVIYSRQKKVLRSIQSVTETLRILRGEQEKQEEPKDGEDKEDSKQDSGFVNSDLTDSKGKLTVFNQSVLNKSGSFLGSMSTTSNTLVSPGKRSCGGDDGDDEPPEERPLQRKRAHEEDADQDLSEDETKMDVEEKNESGEPRGLKKTKMAFDALGYYFKPNEHKRWSDTPPVYTGAVFYK